MRKMKKTTKMFLLGFAIGAVFEGINVLTNPSVWKKRIFKMDYVDENGYLHQFEATARGAEIFNSYDEPVDLGIAKKK
jgi:uncharacterized protein YjeT (DUF2065 family)